MSSRRIHFVVDDTGASRRYRVDIPGIELRRRGHVVSMAQGVHRDQVPELDVLVFHRQFHPAALMAMQDANAQGKVTVLDIDDDYWFDPPSNPTYDAWRQPGVLEGLEQCIRAASIVTTPSPVLAEFLTRFNPNVAILSNMLPGAMWPVPVPHDPGAPLVIGWGGSPSHIPDLELLRGLMESIVAANPQVEFRTHGLREVPFTASDRLRILPGVPFAEYPALIATFDVGLAPLEDTHFNRCKSDLKILEYGAAGIPYVASKVAPYESASQEPPTGFLAARPREWRDALQDLIGDSELRSVLGAAGREWAESRFIERDENIGEWEKAYRL